MFKNCQAQDPDHALINPKHGVGGYFESALSSSLVHLCPLSLQIINGYKVNISAQVLATD